jgi:hypothetical protein
MEEKVASSGLEALKFPKNGSGQGRGTDWESLSWHTFLGGELAEH